jgi:hypothetical protein
MSFDMLPKDIVWMILGEVIVSFYHTKECYRHLKLMLYAFGANAIDNNPMATMLRCLSGVCRQWRKLIFAAMSPIECLPYRRFTFKPGVFRESLLNVV